MQRRSPEHRGPSGPAQSSLLPAPISPRESGAPTTVEGDVVRIRFESEESGFRVISVDTDLVGEPEILVGVFPPVAPGARVRATGRYEQSTKHGAQFRVETLLVVAPSTLDGLERYLGSGMIPGIGPAYAKRIVEAFGADTLDVLDRAPERLREVPGLGARRADAVVKAWEAHRAVGAIMIFLQAHGASPSLATRIFKRFGPSAIDIVSRFPYRLSLDVWGVGFRTADRIARSLGVGADAPERAQAGVLQTIHDRTDRGDVFVRRDELCEHAAAMLERPAASLDEAVDALHDRDRVRFSLLEDGGTAVYPTSLFEAENRVAERLLALLGEGEEGADLSELAQGAMEAFEKHAGVELADAQREAVRLAAARRVLVITGGPGVGKTTLVRAVLALFDHAKLSVRLAAPTGRAAKRMSEATGREAVTLHRLLEFDPKTRGFSRSAGNPIEAAAVVVDEASMLDLALADSLLQAIDDGARLVIVGDVDQLPSVGPGAVLRDVIASGVVPTARLTQIFRQAEGSLIVRNAHRIHEGEMPESAQGTSGEFYVIERTTPESAAQTIREVVTQRIPERFGLDPVRDVQVLAPMHSGEAGAVALNLALQEALNPEGPSVRRGARVLRVADKVMQLRNNYDKNVFNGDVGYVTAIDEAARKLTALFDDREVVYEEGDLDELSLAYATSIHKSQGSEYPAVVVPILMQHFVMLARNLIYTAITRSKRLCVLVADPKAIALALKEDRRDARKTLLAERLLGARS